MFLRKKNEEIRLVALDIMSFSIHNKNCKIFIGNDLTHE